MGQLNILNLIINNNRDLWDQLVGHLFCSRMGNRTARVEGFKDFATNELLFLHNEVCYHLGLYSKMDDWDVLSTKAPAALMDAVNLADQQLQVCIQGLGIPKATLLSIVPKPPVKAYMDWVNDLISTEDCLLALMAPCFLGYAKITTKLLNDPLTKKDTIFYKLWIEPTAGDPGLDKFVQGY
ncbi:unnamed protein product [Rhizoctonia solani]|uniref:Thiaminase-2/PQQC domain-containing protein n=1 Tax=Rhizoctonia solani TaxID=456999 RepID=A0A8H3AV34_9AGAM|nr:unnamed protein product [Rhizoctonia solani]